MNKEQKAPVFIVGAGRSGTTVFFDLFTSHSDFGLFTNYDDLLSSTPFVGLIRRLFDDKGGQCLGQRRDYSCVTDFSSLRPRKTEAYRFWRRYAGPEFVRSYLWSRRPSVTTVARVQGKIDRLCRWQGRERFAAKLTGPGRIGYLREIFPDARFIHIVRDCHSQVHSTLNVGFWKAGGGLERLWWNQDLPGFLEGHLHAAEASGDPVALAAAQWRSVVDSIREESRLVLKPTEYREIAYESFVEEPARCVLELWDWLGLEEDQRAIARLRGFPVRKDANEKWRQAFTDEQKDTLSRWALGPLSESSV